MQKNLQTNEPQKQSAKQSVPLRSRSGSNKWPIPRPQLSAGLILLSILMCAGCAGTQTVRLASCYDPEAELRTTDEPPMQDETNRDLLMEARKLRQALRQCNQEKQDALKIIKQQNQNRQSDASGR